MPRPRNHRLEPALTPGPCPADGRGENGRDLARLGDRGKKFTVGQVVAFRRPEHHTAGPGGSDDTEGAEGLVQLRLHPLFFLDFGQADADGGLQVAHATERLGEPVAGAPA